MPGSALNARILDSAAVSGSSFDLVADYTKKELKSREDAEPLLARLLSTPELNSIKFINRWSELRRMVVMCRPLLQRLCALHIESTGLCGLLQRYRFVSGNRNNAELEALCNELPSLSSLTALEIVAEFVDAEGALIITQALEQNTSVTLLDLSKNPLTEGKSDGYDSNGGLTYGITVSGVAALGNMLKTKNRTIEVVKLEQCSLMPQHPDLTLEVNGVLAITSAITHNWRLRNLSMHNNGLSAAHGAALKVVVKRAAKAKARRPLPISTKLLMLLAVSADLPVGSEQRGPACPCQLLSLLGASALRWVLERIFAYASSNRGEVVVSL
jgi:hypothetical protein